VRKQRFSPFCSPSSVVPLLTARQPHAMRWVALTLRDFASFNSRICERSISCSSLLPETSLSFYKGVAGGAAALEALLSASWVLLVAQAEVAQCMDGKTIVWSEWSGQYHPH
jgi:hypothetical protein